MILRKFQSAKFEDVRPGDVIRWRCADCGAEALLEIASRSQVPQAMLSTLDLVRRRQHGVLCPAPMLFERAIPEGE